MRPLAKAPPDAPRHRTLSFAAVNGWRGPGAIAIAIGHFALVTDFIPIGPFQPAPLLVDLFFVLSGLVIAQAYSAKLASAANIPEYVVRRFGRIWPVQAATLAILVGYELCKLLAETIAHRHFSSPPFSRAGTNLVEAIPTNLLFLHSLGLHDRETWNFPSWSLSVEFATYVAFAAFCLVKPTLRRILSVATIFASLAILAFVAPSGMRSTFDFGIFRCLAGFFAGTLCYEAAVRWPLSNWRFPTLVELSALALIALWLVGTIETRAGFAAPLVFALFVFAFVGKGGLVSRLLATRPMQALAELSFSIYMVHGLVLIFFVAGMHGLARRFDLPLFRLVPEEMMLHPGAPTIVEVLHFDGLASKWAIIAVYLSGVLLASLVVYRLVEVPGRGLFARFAKRIGGLAASGLFTRAGMSPMKRPR